MWIAIIILTIIGIMFLSYVIYGNKTEGYVDTDVACFMSWICSVVIGILFIATLINNLDDQRIHAVYQERSAQIEQQVEQIEDFDSNFMAKVYSNAFYYNQFIVKRQFQQSRWYNAGLFYKGWKTTSLIDISTLPASATMKVLLNPEK